MLPAESKNSGYLVLSHPVMMGRLLKYEAGSGLSTWLSSEAEDKTSSVRTKFKFCPVHLSWFCRPEQVCMFGNMSRAPGLSGCSDFFLSFFSSYFLFLSFFLRS